MLHVYSRRTGQFDLNVHDVHQVTQEIVDLQKKNLTGVALADEATPLLVAATFHHETTAMVSAFADSLWAASTVAENPLQLPPKTLRAISVYYSLTNRLEPAFAAYQKLKQTAPTKVTDTLTNTLIANFALRNDLEKAIGVFDDAKQAGVIPSAAAYTSLLMSAYHNGDIDGAKACALEMMQRGLQPEVADEQNALWEETSKGLNEYFAALVKESEQEVAEADSKGVSVFQLRQSKQ
jgi:pentatricopeptide repeat protein